MTNDVNDDEETRKDIEANEAPHGSKNTDVRGIEKGMVEAIESQNLIEEEMIEAVGPVDSNEDEYEMEESTNPKENSESEKENVQNNTLITTKYNRKPNRTPNYLHRFAFLSVHASVRKWGDKAKEAIKDELKMLVKEKVFERVTDPTVEQMRNTFMIHYFVAEKRDGRIKARVVADGRGQQRYTEEETYSPTVKLESIILNAFIEAHEGRSVATVDIKGAFLKAKVPENLMLMVKMTGELADLMCEINPDMRCNEQGVLYLRCIKALYGHIEAAKLFYDDLDNNIQKKMNFVKISMIHVYITSGMEMRRLRKEFMLMI
jgi:hypothetical protein